MIPMPLLAIAVVFLLLVIVSECRDREASDFFGNFTALLSLLEVISWFLFSLKLEFGIGFGLAWVAILGNIFCNLKFLKEYRR